jgi:hypothetical protein
MPNRRRRLSDSRSVAGPASSSWNACADHGNANQGTSRIPSPGPSAGGVSRWHSDPCAESWDTLERFIGSL